MRHSSNPSPWFNGWSSYRWQLALIFHICVITLLWSLHSFGVEVDLCIRQFPHLYSFVLASLITFELPLKNKNTYVLCATQKKKETVPSSQLVFISFNVTLESFVDHRGVGWFILRRWCRPGMISLLQVLVSYWGGVVFFLPFFCSFGKRKLKEFTTWGKSPLQKQVLRWN